MKHDNYSLPALTQQQGTITAKVPHNTIGSCTAVAASASDTGVLGADEAAAVHPPTFSLQ
jgi:hypothetical protein